MKAVKIPENEKELKQFLDNFVKYAQKRGIRVYSIIAYSPMVESGVSIYPDLSQLARYDLADCARFVDLWFNASDNLKEQMRDWMNKHEGARK